MNETRRRKKANEAAYSRLQDMVDRPALPTAKRAVWGDGRVQGSDGSMWAYFVVPLSPMREAKTVDKQLTSPAPLIQAIESLATLGSTSGVKRRFATKSNYREIHLLGTVLPEYFTAPKNHPYRERLESFYPTALTSDRQVLLGVRLIPTVARHSLKETIDAVAESLMSVGAPAADFDRDYKKIGSLMRQAGLSPATQAQIRVADAWWNADGPTAVPMMAEPDCLHVFSNINGARAAKDFYDRAIPSSEWPQIEGHHAVRFGAVENLQLEWESATDYSAAWWSYLTDMGALCVSVRAKIEPGVITAKELDAQRQAYRQDMEERYQAGKMEKVELEEKEQTLGYVRTLYRGANPPPTVTECSIIFAMPYSYGPVSEIGARYATLETVEMTARQMPALAETWLTSPVRANPAMLELPLTTLAYSGVTELSRVGDHTGKGTLVGFTEKGRQNAWFDPRASMDQDAPPLFGVYGRSGSGKTMLGLWIAEQYSWQAPAIFVNPKQNDSLAPAVEATGGNIIYLDQIVGVDGFLDPMRFSATSEDGIEMASMMLASVNPWGDMLYNYETPLSAALAYGAGKGHRSIGTCLQAALADGQVSNVNRPMVDGVIALAEANPLFRAMCGLSDTGPTLAAEKGLTLIEVGSMSLPLPTAGEEATIQVQRIAINFVRMLVKGATMALMGKDGLVMLDEAWIFLGSSSKEIDQLGRLARSQRVSVGMMTQKVSDAQDAHLEEFLTNNFIGHIADEKEAVAACRLAKLEPTSERIGRITAPGTIEGQGTRQNNWGSMRALMRLDGHGQATREVERGAIFIFADQYDQAIPVEVVLPSAWLAAASTNKADREAYKAAMAGNTPPLSAPTI